VTIETPRLRLERWNGTCAALVVRLSALPEMMRFIGAGEAWSRAHAEEVAAAQAAQWERHGFGWRLAVEKETGGVVGFIALNFTDASTVGLPAGEYEIGWWIDPESQRRGFAQEGAAAMRDHALGELGAPSIVARLQPANRGSARVAESLGMRLEMETTGGAGEPVAVYRLGDRLKPRRVGRFPEP
jgi:RimJ/RimL family protein N-acetyltransferase